MQLDLSLPERTSKPRTTGLTNILDKGYGLQFIRDQLEISGAYVDLAKLGWGTGLITPQVKAKVEVYHSFDIDVCFGGTLFELIYRQNKVDEYIACLKDLGIRVVEISDGCAPMDSATKLGLIEKFSQHFKVLSEVGSKDASVVVMPAKWVAEIRDELSAGAAYVILEGRESGTAGMYRGSGEIRMGLIEEIFDAGIDGDRLVFEAPIKAQQLWFITEQGPNINLANIPLSEVISVETLRLGIRGDTLAHFHPMVDRDS